MDFEQTAMMALIGGMIGGGVAFVYLFFKFLMKMLTGGGKSSTETKDPDKS